MPLVQPRPKVMDWGTTSFGLAVLSVNVTLNKTMPSTNYTVYYRMVSGAGVQIPTTSNITKTGFTAAIGVGIAATVAWIAIEN